MLTERSYNFVNILFKYVFTFNAITVCREMQAIKYSVVK